MKKIVVTLICLVIFMGAVGSFLAGRNFEPVLAGGDKSSVETSFVEPVASKTILGFYIE